MNQDVFTKFVFVILFMEVALVIICGLINIIIIDNLVEKHISSLKKTETSTSYKSQKSPLEQDI